MAKTKAELVKTLRDEAKTAVRSGRDNEALRCYSALEKLEPNEPEWARQLAEAHARLGEKTGQVEALIRASQKFALSGAISKALALAALGLKIEPTNPLLLKSVSDLESIRMGLSPQPEPLATSPVDKLQRRTPLSTCCANGGAKASIVRNCIWQGRQLLWELYYWSSSVAETLPKKDPLSRAHSRSNPHWCQPSKDALQTAFRNAASNSQTMMGSRPAFPV